MKPPEAPNQHRSLGIVHNELLKRGRIPSFSFGIISHTFSNEDVEKGKMYDRKL